tara:strand:+ start:290 stop:652 length:363 start_codon:yes stop_codon:yes gene_type:complete
VVKEEAEVIVNYNTDKQLEDRGVGFDNKKLKPKYKRTTVSIKKRKGQPSDRVTLKDTGAFHKSFTLKAFSEFFTITATNNKTDKLVEKYGEKIFGLTIPNKNRVARDLRPKLIQKLKRRL